MQSKSTASLKEFPQPGANKLVKITVLAEVLGVDAHDVATVLHPHITTLGLGRGIDAARVPASTIWSWLVAGSESDGNGVTELFENGSERWQRMGFGGMRGRPIPRSQRQRIIERDSSQCRYCCKKLRRASSITLDHIVPQIRGGGHSDDNLVVACRRCNMRKGARTPEEAKMRLWGPFVPAE